MTDNLTPLYLFLCFIFAAFFAFAPWAQNGLLSLVTHGLFYMSVFFHEIGHALFGWIFGYPSLPSFDFSDGGGMAYTFDRRWLLQIAIYAAALYGLYRLKTSYYAALLIPAAILFIALAAISLTTYHNAVILIMGHGSEALIGGFMIARALFNVELIRPEERWLNAVIGFYFECNLINMCVRILHDPQYRFDYMGQKGGHGLGDLSRFADEMLWTGGLDSATVFLIFLTLFLSAAVPAAIYWVFIRKS